MAINVKIKKLNEKASLAKALKKDGTVNNNNICFDAVATSIKITKKYIEYGLGFSTEIPAGYCGRVYLRSSASNYNLILSNHVGNIESDYRGEWLVRFKYHQIDKGQSSYLKELIGKTVTPEDVIKLDIYGIGERVCQVAFEPVIETVLTYVDELNETERNTGGFGSTGK